MLVPDGTATSHQVATPQVSDHMEGYNWVLIVVTVVVALLAVLAALYLLVHYQHPEDKNQVLLWCIGLH